MFFVQTPRLFFGGVLAPGGLGGDLVATNSAITACERGMQWQPALALLCQLQASRLGARRALGRQLENIFYFPLLVLKGTYHHRLYIYIYNYIYICVCKSR